VKRPLNAFMLYRRTFQKMVSVFCKGEKENHQEISKATGYCWRNLEPQKIHDIFERLYALERQHHKLAHPEYKYDP
ncbi:uncharacterized protein TRIVIDRAFT_19768, partial [Trichoderma virens Gv29-8]